MQKTNNLQEIFLTRARKENIPVTLFLVNGFQLRGVITGFDCFVVVLESEGKQQVIYKHAISTIAPLRSIDLRAAVFRHAGLQLLLRPADHHPGL